jgi:transcriptional regulator NrdR family protein
MNERPVCHRAEDLVTYLYGEATATEERDFAAHLQQCDACRAEFTLFNQVHDSIVAWRNEALGSVVIGESDVISPVTRPVLESTTFVQHERKLSALAALREFFTVSPFWLRGATALACLLLCALMVMTVSRFSQTPVQVVRNDNSEKVYTEQQMKDEVQRQVAAALAAHDKQKETVVRVPDEKPQPRLASNRTRSKSRRIRGLTQEERVQLAADLGLIPGREDELPYVLPDEPRQ